MAATTKTWVNNNPPTAEDDDLNGFKSENNNLIVGSGQALNTGDLQQTNKAVAHYASAGQIYVDSGAADVYVLSAGNSRANIPAYVDRAKFLFMPGNANAGASTVNIGGLGVKDLNDENGNALLPGRLTTTKEVTIEYILGSDECRLVVIRATFRGALVYMSADESLSAGGHFHIPFDSEEYDTDGIHDNVTNNERLTVPFGVTAIKLHLFTYVLMGAGVGDVFVQISKNDPSGPAVGAIGLPSSSMLGVPATDPAYMPMSTPTINVVEGDFFTSYVRSLATAEVKFQIGTGHRTYFAMEIIN